MRRKTIATLLKEHGCKKESCWEDESFTDGGVTAILGPGWKCFMCERHFTDNACGKVKTTKGGFCDAIAGQRQSSNRTVRVIEVKTQPRFAQAKPQLRKGVEFALGLPGIERNAISVELHVKAAPKSTVRPTQRELTVSSRRLAIQLVVDGEPQFS